MLLLVLYKSLVLQSIAGIIWKVRLRNLPINYDQINRYEKKRNLNYHVPNQQAISPCP
jgi:hypothetical protein